MKNRKLLYITALLLFCFCLMPLTVQAAEEEARELQVWSFTLDDHAELQTYTGMETVLAAETDDLYYGRDALSRMLNGDALTYAYDAIAEGIADGLTEIAIADGVHKISVAEVQLVFETFVHDHAEVFWLHNAYSIMAWSQSDAADIIVGYIMEGAELEEAKAAVEAAVEDILAGIDEEMSEFEKELYLHDVLADRITYAESTHAHNAYGALVDGIAVCEGYAEAFQVLLHRVGIHSYLVTGVSQGQNHEWNLVRIGGSWYHVDLTWDDQAGQLYHAYFNLTDREIAEDHTVYVPAHGLPECTDDEYHYFTVKGGRVDSYDRQEALEMLRNNNLTVRVYVDDVNAVSSYIQSFMNDAGYFASQLELWGSLRLAYSTLGHEVVLRIVPEGLSADGGAVVGDRTIVNVRGDFESTVDLYIAVYDEDGRMIGLESAAQQQLTVNGNAYTVTFDGEADHAKVFALDSSSAPLDAAVEIEMK